MALDAYMLLSEPYAPQDYPESGQSLWRGVAGLLGSVLYGALHFLGWSAEFATGVEQTLWHIATLTILVVAAGEPGFSYLLWLRDRRREDAAGSSAGTTRRTKAYRFTTYFHTCLTVLHCLCSLFLVVESFRQLLFLPNSAFQMPSLSIYLPHFS